MLFEGNAWKYLAGNLHLTNALALPDADRLTNDYLLSTELTFLDCLVL